MKLAIDMHRQGALKPPKLRPQMRINPPLKKLQDITQMKVL